jgi:hypothetical protein
VYHKSFDIVPDGAEPPIGNMLECRTFLRKSDFDPLTSTFKPSVIGTLDDRLQDETISDQTWRSKEPML